ncbi:MAG: hypothetical protein LAT81_15300 [Oceanicaulis sp.]|nr:hypothetical protein [Oceanicaulis sp.]
MILRKPFVLIVLLFVCKINVFAQTYTLFSNENYSPVPFAHITFFNNDSIIGGTYSNSKGVFSIFGNNVKKIEVRHQSYKTISFNFSEIKHIDTLFLDINTVELNEIKIQSGKQKQMYIGYKPNVFPINAHLFNCKRKEVLTLLKSDKSDFQIISSFVFYPKILIRDIDVTIRIVMYLNENGFPGKNRLVEQKVILSQGNKRKLNIDLDEPLIFPEEGIFVGIEILNCTQNFEDSNRVETFHNVRGENVMLLKSRLEKDPSWVGKFFMRLYKDEGYSNKFVLIDHFPMMVPSFGVMVAD